MHEKKLLGILALGFCSSMAFAADNKIGKVTYTDPVDIFYALNDDSLGLKDPYCILNELKKSSVTFVLVGARVSKLVLDSDNSGIVVNVLYGIGNNQELGGSAFFCSYK